MTAAELETFLLENQNIQCGDDEEKEELLFRNDCLAWYRNNPARKTAITYAKMATLCLDTLQAAIDQGLKVENITRITGYFTKTSSWNPGKLGELKERRRTDLAGHCPYEVQQIAEAV